MKVRSLCLCFLSSLGLLLAADEEAPALNPELPTLFIAGDSTAARNNNPNIQGWAEPFADFFDTEKVNISNRARGGRSTRTFIAEGHWAKLLADLKAGDVVIIQFGHNDGSPVNEDESVPEEKRRSRGSLPGLGSESVEIDNIVTGKHEVVRTFGAYMQEMIDEVIAHDATPVLASLTPRDIWKDGHTERGSGEYRTWIRELAARNELGFVDLTRLTTDVWEQLGETAAKTFFTQDYVHSNDEGARFNAAMMLSGLKGLRRGKIDRLEGWLNRTGEGVPADSIGWLNLPEPANAELPSIVLIGDSTVRNGGGDGAGGQWGWGEPLAQIIDAADYNVVNRAIGGLSSRTFLTQGHWDRAKTLIKPGDWVLMQFGHNDAAPLTDNRRARGTIRTAGDEIQAVYNLVTFAPEVVGTYGSYLRGYINDIRALGAHPVICTSVPRKIWDEETGLIERNGGGFPAIAREVAEAENVPLIDLNELVAVRYDAMSKDEVETMFGDERTHTSLVGAQLTAEIVAEELSKLLEAK
ncbi:GDSL-type esterase/lipase family protein [Actomonas aquatica]|uniref:GDSL-type esterase/lipase family protein n=1 Tax=Actomonas aquatica TaxID=2866162 RepID=A0ABZ1CF63_9BACT|nr:GDSL-type esterase/lipase family protein [Opitutus sp. WL0086]WRQ89932.1 GDSL-type esterase/lipase family protein [Opitutus sp. WL0086]